MEQDQNRPAPAVRTKILNQLIVNAKLQIRHILTSCADCFSGEINFRSTQSMNDFFQKSTINNTITKGASVLPHTADGGVEMLSICSICHQYD